MRVARNNKRDLNEREISKALFLAGCSVVALDEAGVPDLLVGIRGKNYLLEVKGPRGKLTPAQEKWHHIWGGQATIVHSVDEALEAVGLLQSDP